MRIVAAFPLLLLPFATAAAAPVPERGEVAKPSAGHCDRSLRPRPVEGRVRAQPQRLIDLPPGNLDLAVMRSLDGCHEPVTVGENYGAVEGPRPVRRPEPPAGAPKR